MLLLLLPSEGAARCLAFDLIHSLDTVPYIVAGEVTGSNAKFLETATCEAEPCQHSFDIRVVEVLKGEVAPTELSVSYAFVHSRPNLDLFSEGDRFVFAITEVEEQGQARLLGNRCGRSGVSQDRIEEIRTALP